MYIDEKQFEEFVLDTGLVSKKDFSHALSEAHKKDVPISEELVSEGKMSEDDVRRTHAYLLGIPYVRLKDQKIPSDILSMIPEPIARNHNIIAYRKGEGELEVAMLKTDDLAAIDFVKKKTGLKILPRLTDVESIKYSLKLYQKSLKDEFGDIISREASTIKDSEGEIAPQALKKIAEDLPVVRIVDALLKHAVLQGASDIHIEPMENQILVRYRIDGILRDAMTLPKNVAASITARIKVLASLKLDEKRLPQDGRFKMELQSEKVSFRVSILPTYYGEKTVMRLLRESVGGFTLESLGFHGENLERVHFATRQKTGLILTTGPTGSGKSTTLYTILDIINTPDVNISTVEDPIEYQMPRINQTQVRPDIGFSFAKGLRSLVRQDPDIIMVGEIRDQETASLAINAALTGHLVLSTLHTNSAAGAMPRLLDMGVEPFLMVSTLDIVIGQRLVRKLCEEKEERKLTKSEMDQLSDLVDMDRMLSILKEEKVVAKGDKWSDVTFYSPKETSSCPSGYKDRIGLHEVLKMSGSIKELVMQGKTDKEIEEQAKKEGMLTMLEDGIFKAAQGITTIEEVLRVISE